MFNLIRQSQASALNMKNGKDNRGWSRGRKGILCCGNLSQQSWQPDSPIKEEIMMSNNNISLFDSDELFFFFFNQQIELVEYVSLFLLFLLWCLLFFYATRSIQSILEWMSDWSHVASALVCFDAAANCPIAQKTLYNCPPPPQTAPRNDVTEMSFGRPPWHFVCFFLQRTEGISSVSEAEVRLWKLW